MNDDIQLLIDAAHASAKIARKFFNESPEVWDKDGGAGPVTEADLAIDKMLHAELRANRPDYGWLSEETEDDPARLSHEHVFIIDPIDGTRAFINGERSWSHSLAIAKQGEVVAAAVHVPMMDRMYSASIAQETRLNGAPILATGQDRLDGATVLAAKSNLNDQHWKGGVPPLDRHFRPSLAYRLSLVAHGQFDAMITLRDCWEWDIAAGDLLVRQANGRSSDRRGAGLRFNNAHPMTRGCVAAGQDLHPLLQSRLQRD
ncbi:MAG: 3'(2'),5'-bisphosphate nucleotidase CysQ [Pseudomonadota bacterium]